MSSDTHSMAESALAKIAEFRRLRYPINVLRKTCAYLGATTGEGAWITIRDALRDDFYGPKAGDRGNLIHEMVMGRSSQDYYLGSGFNLSVSVLCKHPCGGCQWRSEQRDSVKDCFLSGELRVETIIRARASKPQRSSVVPDDFPRCLS